MFLKVLPWRWPRYVGVCVCVRIFIYLFIYYLFICLCYLFIHLFVCLCICQVVIHLCFVFFCFCFMFVCIHLFIHLDSFTHTYHLYSFYLFTHSSTHNLYLFIHTFTHSLTRSFPCSLSTRLRDFRPTSSHPLRWWREAVCAFVCVCIGWYGVCIVYKYNDVCISSFIVVPHNLIMVFRVTVKIVHCSV